MWTYVIRDVCRTKVLNYLYFGYIDSVSNSGGKNGHHGLIPLPRAAPPQIAAKKVVKRSFTACRGI